MPRYVVLFHDDVPDPHFDLLIEVSPDGPLATWRSPRWPILESTDVQKLRDHRRAYLTFEGAIPGNRGTVQQLDSGQCELLCVEPARIEFQLGNSPTRLTLLQLDQDYWRATPTFA